MPKMKIEGSYTRALDGKTFAYVAEYGSASGGDVNWDVRVYVAGQFVGTTGGRLLANLLGPKDLEHSIRSMLERSIEANVGLHVGQRTALHPLHIDCTTIGPRGQ